MTPHDAPPNVTPTDNEITEITYQPDDTTKHDATSADAPKLGPPPILEENRGWEYRRRQRNFCTQQRVD